MDFLKLYTKEGHNSVQGLLKTLVHFVSVICFLSSIILVSV
ncbi:hypothetical protein HG1_57890 [Bacillus anthracis]|uniref:Uncharacterized protein n=1 Tax=Bacillus anthracis TaxID=1392 RepID=A0A640M8G2_BACAN|nr:hypothetical protein HG1_57890 [Bacillus anthracis]